jgi:excisionase family DNA binding protein
MDKHNEILTPDEAGKILKLKAETIRQLMRSGLIPACKVGGSWRTTKGAIYDYMENQMGLARGIHISRREKYPQGVLQVQGRCKAVDKKRKRKTEEPAEIFFSR